MVPALVRGIEVEALGRVLKQHGVAECSWNRRPPAQSCLVALGSALVEEARTVGQLAFRALQVGFGRPELPTGPARGVFPRMFGKKPLPAPPLQHLQARQVPAGGGAAAAP